MEGLAVVAIVNTNTNTQIHKRHGREELVVAIVNTNTNTNTQRIMEGLVVVAIVNTNTQIHKRHGRVVVAIVKPHFTFPPVAS